MATWYEYLLEKGWIILIPLILIFVLGPLIFVNDSAARETLYYSGYSNIDLTGVHYFSCSQDDFFRTGFEATNPVGLRVQGTVCCGLIFKGCTIRF